MVVCYIGDLTVEKYEASRTVFLHTLLVGPRFPTISRETVAFTDDIRGLLLPGGKLDMERRVRVRRRNSRCGSRLAGTSVQQSWTRMKRGRWRSKLLVTAAMWE